MNANWLNQLGDRNPQLLRELRARFQVRSVSVTIGISLVIQILILLFFVLQLPNAQGDRNYCLGTGNLICTNIDWRRWWGDICKTLTYIIPYLLCVPGVYALVTDITQEIQKGTVNFLRLSPRSSQTILLGKLVGVPILSYFSLALMVPLHCLAAILGGISIGFLISFYIALLAWATVLFLTATFAGFSTRNHQVNLASNTQGLALVSLTVLAILPSIQFWNSLTIWQTFKISGLQIENVPWIRWFTLPVNIGVISPHVFLLANLAIIGYWFWRVLQRAFQKPTATLLSKRQSYTIVCYSAILMLGFIINAASMRGIEKIALLASGSIYPTLILIFALSTPRQMLLDWLRNRQDIALMRRSQANTSKTSQTDQLREWTLGEKSPGITAIWINLLIIYGVISLLLPMTDQEFGRSLIGLFLTATLAANYSLLVQLMLLMETSKRNVWAVGSLIFAIVVPGICSVLPGLSIIMGYFTPGLWILLSSKSYRGDFDQPLGIAIFALMIQALLLVLQVSLFRHRLHQMSRQMQTM